MRFLLFVSVLLLAGCAAPAPQPDDGLIHVVASTNVYGDIAAAIGGDRVEVVSIVSDPAQDPHSVEGSARVQLALSRADIVIENGGGYDDWMDTMLAGLDRQPTVISVSELSVYDTSGDFNEHLWYDLPTMGLLAADLAERFGVDDSFGRDLAVLQERVDALTNRAHGTGVAITEPVPLYLLTACGFENVTPSAFSEAIEEGSDVPPATLRDTLSLFADGSAALLVYNEQTTSPQTELVKQAAIAAGVPVVPVSETLPQGAHYLQWMSDNIDAFERAIS